MTLSPDELRAQLKEATERYSMQMPPEDIIARSVRAIEDALVAMGLDPAERTVQESCFLASWLCMGSIVNSILTIGNGLWLCWFQTEIFRQALDHEITLTSMAEVLGRQAQEAMTPECDKALVDARTTTLCELKLGHDGPHQFSVIRHGQVEQVSE